MRVVFSTYFALSSTTLRVLAAVAAVGAAVAAAVAVHAVPALASWPALAV